MKTEMTLNAMSTDSNGPHFSGKIIVDGEPLMDTTMVIHASDHLSFDSNTVKTDENGEFTFTAVVDKSIDVGSLATVTISFVVNGGEKLVKFDLDLSRWTNTTT